MSLDPESVRKAVEAALLQAEAAPPEACRDIAFHLTDWLEDLEAWQEFCANPEAYGAAEVNRLLTDFLVHVPNHLAAASKLLLDIPVTDIFGVGATGEVEE